MTIDTHPVPTVGLDAALAIVSGVRAAAEREGVRLGVVVVDARGVVVASARMDGAQFVALDLAEAKAFTAAAFGHPSDTWRDATVPGGSDWGLDKAAGGRLTPMAGGVPLIESGSVVGGVGASGAAGEVDRRCVERGIEALRAR